MTTRVPIDNAKVMDAFMETFGPSKSPIDPMGSSYAFVHEYALALDGERFDDHRYRHWIPVYEDDHPVTVLMAGAQTGKTMRLITALVRFAFMYYGKMFGYYFPDYHLPRAFSSQRFTPFLKSNPVLGQHMGAVRDSSQQGTDNVLTKTLGESTVFFLSTGARSSTEGLPLKGVFFDEVRRMAIGDIERAQERYSAQVGPIDWKVSTARYPDSDIHAFFLHSDQRYFHTACKCANGVVLSLTYPNCIADLRNATPQLRRSVDHAFSTAGLPPLGMSEEEHAQYARAAYICPTCGTIIVDPREGWWEPHGAGYAHGWQQPQLLSPTYPAGRVLHKAEASEDLQEFYNSTIGMPFLDEEKRPVKPEHLAACVDQNLRWYRHQPQEWRDRHVNNLAMGVDVQAGYHVAVIKALAPNGKFRTAHLEIVEHDEKGPWYQLGHLMHEWDIRIAVIDQAPDYSESMLFAKHWRGRVYLANYPEKDPDSDMVDWHDVGRKRTQRGEQISFRHRVSINKVKGFKWSLGRWVHRMNEVPDPRTLVQVLPRDGRGPVLSPFLRVGTRAPSAICAELYFDHQMRIIFRDLIEDDASQSAAKEQARKQMKRRMVAEFIGADPHFAHANLYADVALARIGQPARPRR